MLIGVISLNLTGAILLIWHYLPNTNKKKGRMSHLSNAFSNTFFLRRAYNFYFNISKLKMQQCSIVGMITKKEKKSAGGHVFNTAVTRIFLQMCVLFLGTSKISQIVVKFICCEKASEF